jgi:poly(A) polymerase Pap1/uncharacterized protein (UPF0248 family)
MDHVILDELKPNSLRALNTYRDTVYLLKTMPALPAFRTAHRFLSLYLRRRGLYSARFGYLGGIHLSLMLNRVVKLIVLSSKDKKSDTNSLTAATIVRTFLQYYASFDWSTKIVCDPSQDTNLSTLKRSHREPVVIRSIFTPTARPNVSESCSSLSAQTFTSEFALANGKLAEGLWKWALRSEQESVSDFLNDATLFIRIKLDTWDLQMQDSDQIRKTIGTVESKMPGILVSLTRIHDLKAQIWPARFVEPGSQSTPEPTEVTGYYLVSLSMLVEDEDNVDTDATADVRGKMISAARMYERLVQQSLESAAKGKDKKAWVSIDVVTKKKVWDMSLTLDSRNWTSLAGTGSYGITESATNTADNFNPASSSTAKASGSAQPEGSRKLRPIQDIIARIRWDEAYDEKDFIIGYEDRFLGVKELELTSWKTEQTDLEFIPSHRIVWIRRKGGDGEKVWDRRLRYDALFGSGVRRDA